MGSKEFEYYVDPWLTVYQGDARAVLAELPAESVHCVVTSPPYWGLRDYGTPGQLGLEPTPEEYVANMVAVFREVRRVLRADGTVWLNLGDSYANDTKWGGSSGGKHVAALHGDTGIGRGRRDTGLKAKDLVGIPWRVAFALQADGWYLRSEIIWAKPNPMPESVTDRPTKAHEQVFLLSKSPRYFFDADAVREPHLTESNRRDPSKEAYGTKGRLTPLSAGEREFNHPAGRNLRSVWTIATEPYGMVPIVRSEAVGADAVGGDIRRTTSRDCPLHGDRPGPEPNARDGERAAASVSPLRSPGTSTDRALGQPAELAPTGPPHGEGSAIGSSGLPLRPHSPAATVHSSESHRTAPGPATTTPYTPSAETTDHTGGTSAGLGLAGLADHTSGSSSELAGSADHPSAQTPDHTARTSSCTCSYRRVTTERVSHFATFPRKLVEPCIKAGTSERGVCPECGAPWERVVERGDPVKSGGGNTVGHADGPMDRGGYGQWDAGAIVTMRPAATTGWSPTCAHVSPLKPQPAVVLDPFAGSGTTGLVAQSLSRRAVLIDLSMDYLGQLMDRNRDIPLGLGA